MRNGILAASLILSGCASGSLTGVSTASTSRDLANQSESGFFGRAYEGDQELSQLGVQGTVILKNAGSHIARDFLEPLFRQNANEITGESLDGLQKFVVISDGTETLTGTRFIKYGQVVNGVEVSGSLVTLEVDINSGKLFSINFHVGNPGSIASKPRITVRQALSKNLTSAETALDGKKISTSISEAKLTYHFSSSSRKWHLIFLIPGTINVGSGPQGPINGDIEVLVDALDGKLIATNKLFDG